MPYGRVVRSLANGEGWNPALRILRILMGPTPVSTQEYFSS